MPKIDYNYIQLRNARLKKGWTRQMLALRCGLHHSTISRLETGEHQNPRTISAVAQELGLSIERLVVDNTAKRLMAKMQAMRLAALKARRKALEGPF